MKSNLRSVHRAVGILAPVFLFVIALSGLALQVHLIVEPPPSIAPPKPGGVASNPPPPITPLKPGEAAAPPPSPSDENIQSLLATVLEAAQRAQPNAPVIAVRLRLQGKQPIGEVTFATPEPQLLAFDAATGAASQLPPSLGKLHATLLRIHRGDLIGPTGVWLSIASGLALIGLAITGLMAYLRMFQARTKINRRALFWK